MSRQYVGMDLHRRRSVIVRMDDHGETLSTVNIENDPLALATEVAKAERGVDVVLEATYGWYWAADVLEECGAHVHLAHPLGVAMFQHQRVKNDVLSRCSDVRDRGRAAIAFAPVRSDHKWTRVRRDERRLWARGRPVEGVMTSHSTSSPGRSASRGGNGLASRFEQPSAA